MGEILGIGTTHHPSLTGTDEAFAGTWQRIVNAPRVDPKWRDQRNWPAGMLDEVGNDQGLSAGKRYRERMWANFRKQRKIVDDFNPDFIVIIADDQYENFQETIIPPFCVFGLDDDFEQEVWSHGFAGKQANYWNEPRDWKMRVRTWCMGCWGLRRTRRRRWSCGGRRTVRASREGRAGCGATFMWQPGITTRRRRSFIQIWACSHAGMISATTWWTSSRS